MRVTTAQMFPVCAMIAGYGKNLEQPQDSHSDTEVVATNDGSEPRRAEMASHLGRSSGNASAEMPNAPNPFLSEVRAVPQREGEEGGEPLTAGKLEQKSRPANISSTCQSSANAPTPPTHSQVRAVPQHEGDEQGGSYNRSVLHTVENADKSSEYPCDSLAEKLRKSIERYQAAREACWKIR
jgi:hypothetical protein